MGNYFGTFIIVLFFLFVGRIDAQTGYAEVKLDRPYYIERSCDNYFVYGVAHGDTIFFSFPNSSFRRIYSYLEGIDDSFVPIIDNTYYIITEKDDSEIELTLLFCNNKIGNTQTPHKIGKTLHAQLATENDLLFVENAIEFSLINDKSAVIIKILIYLEE